MLRGLSLFSYSDMDAIIHQVEVIRELERQREIAIADLLVLVGAHRLQCMREAADMVHYHLVVEEIEQEERIARVMQQMGGEASEQELP